MMALSLRDRRFFLQDALAPYTGDLRINRAANPIQVEMNGRGWAIHTLSVTDSGEGRSNEDEQRIQITDRARSVQRALAAGDVQALFIGFFPRGDVFTAWDPEYVLSLRATNGTVYARLSHHDEALRRGAALYRFTPEYLPRDASTLSFPAEQLGFYLENWVALHQARTADELRRATAAVAGSNARTGGRSVRLGGRRRTVSVTRTAYARDPEFTRLVLEAYGHSCCVCARQMQIVEAAHIIPHSFDDSTDEVTNGLALCVEHHRLYDRGILLITSRGKVRLNAARVSQLQRSGHARGLSRLRHLDGKAIHVPEERESRPDARLLGRGAKIRSGEGG